MESTEPEIAAVRDFPDGTTVNIPNGFTRKARELYPSIIQELKKHDDGSPVYWIFVHEVLNSADHARAWQRAVRAGRPDPNDALRQSDSDFEKGVREAAAAARTLIRLMESRPDLAARVTRRARLKIKGEDGRVPLHALTSDANGVDVVLSLLSLTAEVLEETPSVKAGPWMHRCQIGPLLYRTPIDTRTRHPDGLVNGLLFEIVLHSRRFTAASPWTLQPGMVMPTRPAWEAGETPRDPGRPLWPLAAAGVSDALGVQLDDNAARTRVEALIKRNPGLGWVGWPPPPPDLFDRYI